MPSPLVQHQNPSSSNSSHICVVQSGLLSTRAACSVSSQGGAMSFRAVVAILASLAACEAHLLCPPANRADVPSVLPPILCPSSVEYEYAKDGGIVASAFHAEQVPLRISQIVCALDRNAIESQNAQRLCPM
eukprot:6003655-Amphidinium_carterae.1